MFAFGKNREPMQVALPDGDLSLDKIIENLSLQREHYRYPSSDDFQSLLVHLGSDFKIVNRNPDTGEPGTNIHRATLLCAALLLKKLNNV